MKLISFWPLPTCTRQGCRIGKPSLSRWRLVWCVRKPGRELRIRVDMWAERLGVQVRRVQIRAMRTKWASCSTNGTLTLNADVLKLPPDLVDYVLCHDLLHLKLPDHGKGFRASIGCYLPDWRKRELALARWSAR